MTAPTERHYRRLLWAYPGSYRRRHGAEIVTTLLDMAEAGHGRPTAAETLHLIACGLRQRFRLPAGRPLAGLAAVLAAILLGALGTAGGTRLGWQTATPVPAGAEMRALTAAASGMSPSGVPVYPWRTAMNGPVIDTRVIGQAPYSADRVRTALTSAGWRITTLTESTGGILVDLTADQYRRTPTRSVRVTATKDGLSLRGESTTVVGGGSDGDTDAGLEVWAAFAAAVVPAAVLYRNLYQVLSYDSGAPNPYIVDRPDLPGGLVAAGSVIALLSAAAAVLIAARGARTGPGQAEPETVASS